MCETRRTHATTCGSLSAPADVFRVAFICTGNQARSPLAEAFFRRFAGAAPARATSYGTAKYGEAPALPFAIESGRALGVDIGAHRSRPLTPQTLATQDLVIAFEPFHVSLSVIEGGAVDRRTFLLTEFVPLLREARNKSDPVSRARSVVEDADAVRSFFDGSRPRAIPDPARSSRSEMQRVASEIEALVWKLVAGLFGTASDS